jgi:hypothetical protein
MNLTTIQVLERAAELGLKLGVEPPDTLTVQPVASCPAEFADTLRAHKSALLALLKLPFVMLRSRALDGEILFFCQDEATKVALVEAGADSFSIYTKTELKVLCEQNRITPISQVELRKLHELKKTFDARITSEDFK